MNILRTIRSDSTTGVQVDSQSIALTPRAAAALRWTCLAVLIAFGFSLAVELQVVQRILVHVWATLSSWSAIKLVVTLCGGLVIAALLLRYSEVALALFFVVGAVKGDPRLSSAPVDLTLAVGGLIVLGTALRILFTHKPLSLPKEYLLYLPIVAMMLLSLTYTPELSAGLDKVGRFLFLTSLGIVCPFVLLDSTQKIRTFLYTLLVSGALLAFNSISMLGGSERLTAPSGLNTELGFSTGLAMVILWGLLFPNLRLAWRGVLFPLVGLLGVILVGSGARTANVSAVFCVLLALFFAPKLWKDVLLLGCAGLLVLSLLQVPEASINYLESLAHPSEAMGTRDALMDLGVTLATEHPLLGVGIQGYKFHSPNPITYNYPHNMYLELGAELGFLPVLAFLGLSVVSFREALVQRKFALPEHKYLANTVLMLLIFSYLDGMVSGDMNDRRLLWCALGLPFVLRQLFQNSSASEFAAPGDDPRPSAGDGWRLRTAKESV